MWMSWPARPKCRAVFEAGKKGRIAGSQIKEGKATRDSLVKVIRGGKVIAESRVAGLRRFKDDVKEVIDRDGMRR